MAKADFALEPAMARMQSKIAGVIGDVLARFDGAMAICSCIGISVAWLQIACCS